MVKEAFYEDDWKMMCKRLTIGLLIFEVMLIITFFLAGCGHVSAEPVCREAIVKLPDGTIISGELDGYVVYSYGCMRVVIDGVSYNTHRSNIVIIER